MNRYLGMLSGIILFIMLFISAVFPMGAKEQLIPMKTYPTVDITDGEYLHYGNYYGGEKDSDYYYVTRKVSNIEGDIYYHTYFDIITASANKKPPENYKNWPAYFIINPKLGSVVESEGKLDAEDSKNWANGGGLIYWHYLLKREKGEVEYISRWLKRSITNESKYRVELKKDIPSMNMWGGSIFVPRFLDIRSGGIYLYILPEIMKGPMAITWRFLSKETIVTKAGSFKINKFYFVLADPFVGRLMGAFTKDAFAMIEDSDRRLTIRSGMTGGSLVLEEISNVKAR